LFAVAAGTNVSTPLLLLYRDRLDLSGPATTVVFGIYAAGLTPSLLASGPLSDRFGRRTLVLPFAVLAGIASLLFAGAQDSFPLLLAARFLQGLVSGAVFTAGSAWVAELCAANGEGTAAGRRNAVALAAGFALGPLFSALLATWLPAPLVLPYVMHAAVVVAGVLVVLHVPETAARRRREVGDPAREPMVPRDDRLLAVTALGPVATCVYAFPATLIGGLPFLVALPGDGVLASGVLAGLTLGTGAVVAPYQRRLGSWTAVAAAVVGAVGLALTALCAATGGTLLLVPAALLLGAGSGWSLAAGLSLTGRLAPDSRRGALTGVFYTTAYLGFAAPFVLTSVAAGTGPVLPLGIASALAAVLAVRLVAPAGTGRL